MYLIIRFEIILFIFQFELDFAELFPQYKSLFTEWSELKQKLIVLMRQRLTQDPYCVEILNLLDDTENEGKATL